MSGTHPSMVQKLLFGVGQSAESIKSFAFGTLLMLYYNQVLGLSGALSRCRGGYRGGVRRHFRSGRRFVV